MKGSLFSLEKIIQLKDKFNDFFKQKKKLKALENYSEAVPGRLENYLKLLRKCMNEGFPDEIEAAFLDHQLRKCEIKFEDWSHKTKWLKAQIKEKQKENKAYPMIPEQLSFLNKAEHYEVPLELLSSESQSSFRRRI